MPGPSTRRIQPVFPIQRSGGYDGHHLAAQSDQGAGWPQRTPQGKGPWPSSVEREGSVARPQTDPVAQFCREGQGHGLTPFQKWGQVWPGPMGDIACLWPAVQGLELGDLAVRRVTVSMATAPPLQNSWICGELRGSDKTRSFSDFRRQEMIVKNLF